MLRAFLILSLSPEMQRHTSAQEGASPTTFDGHAEPALDATLGDGLRGWRLHAPAPPSIAEVCPDGEVTYGIDVSKWQGTIDWAAVAAAGVEYAFIRVSDGSTVLDEFFDVNWQQAKANGITVGAYQFFRPAEDPVAQADLLLSMMGALAPDDLPPVIDIEVTGGLSGAEIIDAAQAWIDVVEADVGVAPIVYTAPGWWDGNVGLSSLGAYPLWVANWGVTCPSMPTGWSDYVFHQFSATGTVPGISGDVDENYFNGPAADLDAWTVGPSVCGDGVCSADESPDSCPEDCPPCGIVPASGATIDNGDPCYELYGDPTFWRDELDGYGGSLVWTHATALADPENYAIWRLYFEQAGTYELETFATPEFFASAQAAYQVRRAGVTDSVAVYQSVQDGWFSLGEFSFDAGGDQWIRLDDNTGEPGSGMVRIGYDALRLTPTPSGGTTGGTGGGETGGADSETGGEDTLGDDAGATTDAGEDGDTGVDSGTGVSPTDSGFDSSAGADVTRTDEGCGCQTSGGAARRTSALLWFVLAPLWWRRRYAGRCDPASTGGANQRS